MENGISSKNAKIITVPKMDPRDVSVYRENGRQGEEEWLPWNLDWQYFMYLLSSRKIILSLF
jgi:hypothetical protein